MSFLDRYATLLQAGYDPWEIQSHLHAAGSLLIFLLSKAAWKAAMLDRPPENT